MPRSARQMFQLREVTDVVTDINVVVPDEVGEFIAARGGNLYVDGGRTPARRGTLRPVFTPPDDQPERRCYLGARSRAITVTPHADVATPRVPARVRAGDVITVAGFITPRHPEGGSSVEFVFQRRGAGGAWVPKLSVEAVDRDAPGRRGRYAGSARVPAAGTWRVQAAHPADEAQARSYSTWRSFTVK